MRKKEYVTARSAGVQLRPQLHLSAGPQLPRDTVNHHSLTRLLFVGTPHTQVRQLRDNNVERCVTPLLCSMGM